MGIARRMTSGSICNDPAPDADFSRHLRIDASKKNGAITRRFSEPRGSRPGARYL
jgi:hypothetical protein